MSILVVFGSRPEAIKLGPVVAELRALGAPVRVLATGQHTTLLKGTPAESDLGDATSLGLVSDGRVMRWVHNAIPALRAALGDADVVVVQGDTMSAFAAAQAATAEKRVLVHVEAGVRSHVLDEPWPEERFRLQIDRDAVWRYAATSTAYANLVREGCDVRSLRLPGNPGVSALARYTSARAGTAPSDHALVTLHRREFLDSAAFPEVLAALAAAAADHAAARFLWPMHPAVAKRLPAGWLAALPANLIVVPPLEYAAAASLLAASFGVLTDSGGLVEEAATLGVPSIQLRNVSDRPEAIEAGVSRLEPPTAVGVAAGVQALTSGSLPRRPTGAYGAEDSATQIARLLANLVLSD